MAKKRFNDHPFPYHAEFELEVATLTNLGVGLGRVAIADARLPIADSADAKAAVSVSDRVSAESESGNPQSGIASGWVVMVPFALPGERVRVRVFRNHKNYSEADLLAVLRPAAERIAPRCPLFGACGGCQYQHLAYPEQLRWKRRQVAELLRHLARLEFPVNPVIPSPQEFGYRSKITPHFEVPRAPVATEPAGAPAPFPIGFLKAASRFALIDVPQCPIATAAINARLPAVRTEIRAKAAAGLYRRGATVLLRHSLEGVTCDYEAPITEEIALAVDGAPLGDPPSALWASRSLRLRFLARDFFQNNPFILSAFTGYVRDQAAACGRRFLVDAYCGSGLFALAAASRFERVVGVEVSESSVRWAQENAASNGVANATFRIGDAAEIFAGLDFPPAETAVVIDPPRRGCDASFLQQLVAFGPSTVVYVSCDPATQMRDLSVLVPAGYELTAVQPFDLFPQTRHLECVITLQRKPAGPTGPQ